MFETERYQPIRVCAVRLAVFDAHVFDVEGIVDEAHPQLKRPFTFGIRPE